MEVSIGVEASARKLVVIRPIIKAGSLAVILAAGIETTVLAQVPGFPTFGQGPQGAPPASFPGATPQFPPVATPAMPAPGAEGSPDQDISFFEPGKLVAQVGDQPIFYGEILGDLNQIVNSEMPDASETLKEARRRQLFQEFLPKMVEQKMVYVDFLLSVPKVEERLPEILEKLEGSFFQSEVPKLMERLKVEDQQAMEEKLREAGTSLRNVKRAWIESQIVSYHLSGKFTEEREVTHDQMLEYYRTHQEAFSFPARVRWEELMVRINGSTDPVVARRTLEEMGNEVVFGAPLDAVARRRSEGSTASQGGLHEWTKETEITDAALKQVLFSIRVGYLSDIIETPQGLWIVRVLEREPASVRAFRDVQTEIIDQIQMDRRKETVRAYLTELRTKVPVWTIMDGDSDSPPEGGPTVNTARRD